MNQMLKIAELFNAVMDREFGPLEKDGLVAIRLDWAGKVIVHVTDRYFEENYSQYEWTEDDQPMSKNVRLSFETTSGNEIFCLKKATFERVA